jgi:hypothetical protein
MSDCFVDTIMLEKKIGETGMGDIVLRCNGKRASPERFAITPIAVLNPGRPREGGNYYRLTGNPVQKTKWLSREQPLCFQRREDRDALLEFVSLTG